MFGRLVWIFQNPLNFFPITLSKKGQKKFQPGLSDLGVQAFYEMSQRSTKYHRQVSFSRVIWNINITQVNINKFLAALPIVFVTKLRHVTKKKATKERRKVGKKRRRYFCIVEIREPFLSQIITILKVHELAFIFILNFIEIFLIDAHNRF